MYHKIQNAVAYIQDQLPDFLPQIGIVLGTGLGNLSREIDQVLAIPYANIPHFAESTVESHAGKLIFGYLNGVAIVAMAGRFHYYEGYSMEEVTFPIRVLKYLKIERLVISNAAGGVQAHLYPGDLVFIKDHINLHAQNPLRGKNDERLGVRFPDMLKAYDSALNQQALAIAEKNNIRAFEGVYVGTQGPNLETPAEYNFFNLIGGAAVGMSTVPEVLVAKHMNLPVFVVSVISNRCYPIDEITETTVEDVIQVVNQAEAKLTLILKELLVTMVG
ncbi:purine-nucleoside phosphorylase [Aureispira anguillae]|uniref:Purine nucleoside phosphorylase n=1 Tax=Aureispira anguillae TaxID=2864201 RepID=A0A916DV61_9BACT|nr:purine-nucleoside phosphorylase [Aureispira anguillae]BDS14031.1 purine-nucleoside phosphorylase [Aureispira anguillae]